MNGKSFVVLIVLVMLCVGVLGNSIRPAQAIIWIEGHIVSDTTWAPVDTYRVINNTFVDPNVTLTILPGVRVQFADGFSLTVEGSLNATGTDANQVIFTSSRSSPSPGVWGRIKLAGNMSTLRNVRVEYAVDGIAVESLEPIIIDKSIISNCLENGILLIGSSNVLIETSTVEQNKNGISTDSALVHSGVAIIDNKISNNIENGIYLQSSGREAYICNVTIVSNNISSNGGNGVFFFNNDYRPYYPASAPHGCIGNVTFSFNTVSSNIKNGIYLYGYCGGFGGVGCIRNVTFSSNIVWSNLENGIYLESYGYTSAWDEAPRCEIFNVTFSDNVVSSNAAVGIYLNSHGYGGEGAGFGSIYDMSFEFNNVSLNGDDGILLNVGDLGGSIYNSAFLSNTLHSNQKSGLVLNTAYSDAWGSQIFNFTFCFNTVSSNKENGVYCNARDHSDGFDLTMENNTLTENSNYGIYVSGGINSLLRYNSISRSLIGVFLVKTLGNLAIYNDIFSNSYGMNVTNGASINAEHNYWGSAAGPYHASLNPEGDGNPVDGDGTDLDFIPFETHWLVSEFPSFLILPLFMIVTLLAVLIYRRKHSVDTVSN